MNKAISKKISIICPVYNVEIYLAKCISSIINQTYKNFELLLIDDGSTDRSYDICKKYECMDGRLKVIHTENGGAASARNVGLDHCTGEYVAFVDSDDHVEENWLSDMVAVMDGYDLCASGFYIQENEREPKSHVSLSSKVKKLNAKQCFHEVFDGDVTTYLWNKLFRRKIIEDHEIRFDTTTYWGEDAQFISTYCTYLDQAIVINKPLYYYVQNDGSIVHSKYNPKMMGFLHGYRNIIEDAKRFEETDTVDITIAVHCQSLIYRIFIVDHKHPDIRILKEEIKRRRAVLRNGTGRRMQRLVCLSMSYSVFMTCVLLGLYKKYRR